MSQKNELRVYIQPKFIQGESDIRDYAKHATHPTNNGLPNIDYYKRFTAEQSRQVITLIKKECCNFDNSDNNCVLLEGKCPQISNGNIICNWLSEAVLPLKPELEAQFIRKVGTVTKEKVTAKVKKCAECGKRITVKNLNTKYCQKCSVKVHSKKSSESRRKVRQSVCNEMKTAY